jgi:ADP-heptose:LPS heptosyltransferase/polysaccharide pyruvyl transferase WcaK-like protein
MKLSKMETTPTSLGIRTHQMFSGLGAGNIGDELMMLGFLNLIQPGDGSAIEIWHESSPDIPWFPRKYAFIPWLKDHLCERSVLASQAVLLVGGTSVAETSGVEWPLGAMKKRLMFCHENSIPVHVVGIGVDHLTNPDAIKIFQDAFLPIKSWSVRSINCRNALTALGVSESRIAVASDLAWLYEPEKDCRAWAASKWQSLGIDLDRPLIGVNVVREIWGQNKTLYQHIAMALDRIVETLNAQIAFMCNEVREGDYFDHAAALSVIEMMKSPAVFLPNHYYHPDEMIALLSHVDISLSQRYHFTIQSIIAGTVPVSFARGQKLTVLMEELGMEACGSMDIADPDTVCGNVVEALESRAYWRRHLALMKNLMQLRAVHNGGFIRHLSASQVMPDCFSVAAGRPAVEPVSGLAAVNELEPFGYQSFSVRFVAGWFEEEVDASGNWRWSDGQGVIELYCDKDMALEIQFEIYSVPTDNRIAVLWNDHQIKEIDNDWLGFQRVLPMVLDLKKGAGFLTFRSDKNPVQLPADSRDLSFSIKNFRVKTIPSSPAASENEVLSQQPRETLEEEHNLMTRKEDENSVLVLSFDSLGDIVLRQPLFVSLLDRGYSITVLVRTGYEHILPILDSRLSVLTVDIDPYQEITESVSDKLNLLFKRIQSFNPDRIICCPYQRTFLDEWILKTFSQCKRYGLNGICFPYDQEIVDQLYIPNTVLFDCAVDCDVRESDIQKNSRLLTTFLNEEINYRPCIRVTAVIAEKTDAVLIKFGLYRGKFAVICPVGIANVKIKTWPNENYAALIDAIQGQCGLEVLIICQQFETSNVNEILIHTAHPERFKIWIGEKDETDVLVGLMEASRIYIGNDTGPMHIAAALNKPVIAIFGGGHWPRFLPKTDRFAVFTQELPCFYCEWNYCIFENAPCVKQIDIETVKQTVTKMLQDEKMENLIHLGNPDTCQQVKRVMKNHALGPEDRMPFNLVLHGLPKITIVTPSYNQGQFLEECIDSVLSQNYPNLEYIIMDGGSTDNSVEIIQKYEKYLTYWQSRPDGGHYPALDEGFKKSTGSIMAWINSDDKYHKNAFYIAAYVFLMHDPIEWIMGRPTNWNEDGNLRDICADVPLWNRQMYLNRQYRDPTIQQESVFWRRSLWEKAGGYIEKKWELAGDLELWRRFFRHAGLTTVNALMGGFRNQPDQKTKKHLDEYFQEAESIIDEEAASFAQGEFTHIPASTSQLDISEQVMDSFIRTLAKIGYHSPFRYVTFDDKRLVAAREALVVSEWDRRLQYDQVRQLTKWMKESEASYGVDRQSWLEQTQKLIEWLKESEKDRGDRLVVINNLQARLEAVEQEKQKQIAALTERLTTTEAEKNACMECIHDLEAVLKEANRKAEMLGNAYQTLENSFVVRKARQMGFIQVGRLCEKTLSEAETKDVDHE